MFRGGEVAAEAHFLEFDDERERLIYFEPPSEDELPSAARDELGTLSDAIEAASSVDEIRARTVEAAQREADLGVGSRSSVYWRCRWSRETEQAIRHVKFSGPYSPDNDARFYEAWLRAWNDLLVAPENQPWLRQLKRRHRRQPFSVFVRMSPEEATEAVLSIVDQF